MRVRNIGIDRDGAVRVLAHDALNLGLGCRSRALNALDVDKAPHVDQGFQSMRQGKIRIERQCLIEQSIVRYADPPRIPCL